jgi:hypothetical protein
MAKLEIRRKKKKKKKKRIKLKRPSHIRAAPVAFPPEPLASVRFPVGILHRAWKNTKFAHFLVQKSLFFRHFSSQKQVFVNHVFCNQNQN